LRARIERAPTDTVKLEGERQGQTKPMQAEWAFVDSTVYEYFSSSLCH
jgi:hypothetical protein